MQPPMRRLRLKQWSASFGLSAQSVADVSKVKSELIKTRRIVFTPNTQLKKVTKQNKKYKTLI